MSRLTLALAVSLLALESALAIWIVATSGQTGTDSFGLGIPAGIVFVLSGLVALERRPENMTGVYLAAAGYLWLLAALGDSGEPWIYTLGFALAGLVWVPFGALVLSYPSGRLESRLERLIPVTAGVLLTGTALVQLLFDRTPAPERCEACPESAIVVAHIPGLALAAQIVGAVGSVLLIALVIGLFLRRWRKASAALRRLLAPVLGAATLTLVAAGLFVVADQLSDRAGEDALLLFYVVFTTVPLAFLFGVLRMRLARSSVAEVVMALERGTPLRDALAKALGDPSLQVAYRLDSSRGLVGGGGWVDPLGQTVREPTGGPERAVRFIDRRGERIAALGYDATLTNEPELVDAVTAAAGLALANERLQAELRAEIRLTGALADTAPALLSNVDTQGRMLKVNPAALRASGYESEDEVRERFFWEIFIDDHEREEMKARFAAAAPDFPQAEYENTFTNAKGERLVIYWRAAPVLDDEGNVLSIVGGGLDVTDRHRLEAEKERERAFLNAIANNAPSLLCLIDDEGRVTAGGANKAFEHALGYEPEQVGGQVFWDEFVARDDADGVRSVVERVVGGEVLGEHDHYWKTRSGERLLIAWTCTPLPRLDERTLFLISGVDVTERQEREQEAERQRDFLYAITTAVPSFLIAVDRDAVVVEHLSNSAFLETFGWPEDEIVGQSLLGLVAREDDHAARTAIANAAGGFAQPELESVWYDRSGNERNVAWTARHVLDPGGRHLVLVSGSDVTVRRRQETEIRASRARLVAAEDEARRKLERNLHDGAQQRLVALSVALRLAETKLGEDPVGAGALVAGAREELGHALEELRELARGIHPAVLTARGLGPALESLVARMSIPVELRHPGERLAPAVEAVAYYVVAESLTNVVKYAQATEAEVRVTRDDGRVVVTVTDDGVGGADPETGSGLRGLADRVAALDGVLVVESASGRGTQIRAEIPLPTEAGG